jgi:hypothetical protein
MSKKNQQTTETPVGIPAKRTVKTMSIVDSKCFVCGKQYAANKIEYTDGQVTVTPPRCPDCQTVHVTNGRVNKTLKDLALLGNLKARLTAEQRQAILSEIAKHYQALADRYSGTEVKSASFDLATM